MSINKEKLLKKARELNLKNDREGALKLIKLNKNKLEKQDKDVDLMECFLLYHIATDEKDFKYYHMHLTYALRIANNIFRSKTSTKTQKIKAGSYLAQIHLFLGNKNKAIKQATNNYHLAPNSLTTNRLADIYHRLGQNKLALKWYKKSIELSEKEGEKLPISSTGLAFLLLDMGEKEKGMEVLRKTISLIKEHCKNPEERKSLFSLIKNKLSKEEKGSLQL